MNPPRKRSTAASGAFPAGLTAMTNIITPLAAPAIAIMIERLARNTRSESDPPVSGAKRYPTG